MKLVATDLDGTLFYPKRRIGIVSRRNRTFLREFVQSGRQVVLVSGRNINIAEKLTRKVGVPFDMIACNGSVILKDGSVVEDSSMDAATVRALYDHYREDPDIMSWCFMSDRYPLIIVPCGIHPFLKFCYRIAMFFQFSYMDEHIIGETALYRLLDDPEAHIYKAMAIVGVGKKGKQRARKKTQEFIDAYGTRFEVLWSNQTVEFMNKGVNKANALKKFINMLQLNTDDVAVVGDSGNDIPLFEAFEHSYVMSHAPKEVKRKAKTEIQGVYCLKKFIM